MGLQLFVYYIVQLEEHRVNINIRWYIHCSDDHSGHVEGSAHAFPSPGSMSVILLFMHLFVMMWSASWAAKSRESVA